MVSSYSRHRGEYASMAHHTAPNAGSPAGRRPMATHAEIIAVPEAIAYDIASHVNDEEIANALGDQQLPRDG